MSEELKNMGPPIERPWSEAFYSKQIDEESAKCLEYVRAGYAALAETLQRNLPSGRYKSMVLTHLENSAMCATKALSHQ